MLPEPKPAQLDVSAALSDRADQVGARFAALLHGGLANGEMAPQGFEPKLGGEPGALVSGRRQLHVEREAYGTHFD